MQIWFFFSQNKTTNDIFDWLQNKSNAHLEWINSTINRVAQSSKFFSPVYFNWISQLQSKQQQQWWKKWIRCWNDGKIIKTLFTQKKRDGILLAIATHTAVTTTNTAWNLWMTRSVRMKKKQVKSFASHERYYFDEDVHCAVHMTVPNSLWCISIVRCAKFPKFVLFCAYFRARCA